MSTKSKVAAAGAEDESKQERLEIPAPNFKIVEFELIGDAPLVIHKFSAKAREQIIATQKEGAKSQGKKKREPKDFDAVYMGAFHVAEEGWYGIPAGAFRNGMVSACRTVGYKMTHAKLAAFVLSDGIENDDGTPLVRIIGTPERHTTYARNDNGSVDIRVRPMWKRWSCKVRVRFDADMFTQEDVANLLMRVGQQVGVGEGRPDSKKSAGMGWGLFHLGEKQEEVKRAG